MIPHFSYKAMRTFLVLVLSFSMSFAFGQIAELHVIAEPGVALFTDGKLFSETDSGKEEIVIDGISAESHPLQCTKEGCYAIKAEVNLQRSHTVYYIAHKLICKDSIDSDEMDYSGDAPSCLTVRSNPPEVHFSIPKYVIVSDKAGDSWMANNIPSGPCDVYFQYHDTDIITTVDILPGTQTYLYIDLVKHTVLDSIVDPCTCCVPDSAGFVTITGEANPHRVMQVFEGFEVEKTAEFKGGDEQMNQFVANNIKYPKEAFQAAKNKLAEVGGQTLVEFVVETDGTIDIETVQVVGRHVGYGCEEAIIAMILEMSGKWQPAMVGSQAVRQKVRVPVAINIPI